MTSLVAMTNVLGVAWLAYWALKAIRRLAKGSRHCILFVFPLHLLFCGLPMFLDLLIGVPEYRMLPGFAAAADHEATNIIYCGYVSLAPVLWWLTGLPRQASLRAARVGFTGFIPKITRKYAITLWIVLVAPVILALCAPDPQLYLRYSPAARQLTTLGSKSIYHIWVGRSSLFAALAGALLIYRTRRVTRSLLVVTPWLLTACWLHGKRNIVGFSLILLLCALWQRGTLRGKKLLFSGITVIVCLVLFSFYYQTHLRFSQSFIEAKSWRFWYENARIDYGRDDVIKLNIYAEIHPKTSRVLDFRGQSLYIIATMWIPRHMWPDKPISYPHRLTEVAMNRPSPGGGSLTTTCLGESISNFSWFGILVGPLLLSLVCRIGDSCRDQRVFIATILVSVFMQTAHLAPWAPIAALWALLVAHAKLRSRRIPPRGPRRPYGQVPRHPRSAYKMSPTGHGRPHA